MKPWGAIHSTSINARLPAMITGPKVMAAQYSSARCASERDWTYFGEAYFDHALRGELSFVEAFDQAATAIAKLEHEFTTKTLRLETAVRVARADAPALLALAALLDRRARLLLRRARTLGHRDGGNHADEEQCRTDGPGVHVAPRVVGIVSCPVSMSDEPSPVPLASGWPLRS